MPRTRTVSDAEAAAHAVAEAQRQAEEAAISAASQDHDIAAEAAEQRIGVLKAGAEQIADAHAKAAEAQEAAEMAAFQADELAAKLAGEATRSIPVGPGQVRIRITALGHNKVHTGEDVGADGTPFPKYHRGAQPPMALAVAKLLIAKGYAESVG